MGYQNTFTFHIGGTEFPVLPGGEDMKVNKENLEDIIASTVPYVMETE